MTTRTTARPWSGDGRSTVTGVGEHPHYAAIAIVLAVGAVLVFAPDGFSRWVLPKEAVLVGAAVLASLAAPAGRLPPRIWVFIGAAAAVLVAAAVSGSAPFAQVFGRWPRYDGLVSLPVYVAAAWSGARLLGPAASTVRKTTFILSVAGGSILLGAVSVLEATGLRPIASDLDRPGALLGNASDQGIVAAAFAVVLLCTLASGAAVSRFATVLTVLGSLCALVTVGLSGSRAGVLALATGIVLGASVLLWWSVTTRRPGVRNRVAAVTGAFVVVGTIVVIGLPQSRSRVLGQTEFSAETVDQRLLIWSEAFQVVMGRPFLGVGPSGFADAVVRVHGPGWYAASSPGSVLDSPHNVLLQFLVAGGPLLLAVGSAFAVWAAMTILGPLRAADRTRAANGVATTTRPASALPDLDRAGLLAASIAGSTAIVVGWMTHFPTAATGILCGLLLGIGLGTAAPAASRSRRATLSVILSTWFIVLAVASAAESVVMRALDAPTPAEADQAFVVAQAMRPWDADLASIAAQSITARAEAGQPGAAPIAVRWADRAVSATPTSVPARLALAVATRVAGRPDDALAVLDPLVDEVRFDADIALQRGIALAMSGRIDEAVSEVERAATLRPRDPTIQSVSDQLAALDR